jgi:4-hydroxybenzoyl-CoA thioesterase
MTGRFERSRHIRFAHCDPAGIVFYPQYLVMFNGLVEDWITDGLGIPYPELIGRRRIGLPTVSLHCEFRAVSRMGDDVVLGLQVEAIGNRSLTLRLDCTSGGQTRVQVRNVIVTTSLDTHRAIALPEDLRAAVERFRASE